MTSFWTPGLSMTYRGRLALQWELSRNVLGTEKWVMGGFDDQIKFMLVLVVVIRLNCCSSYV